MKKVYEQPKAEKMEFDYEETVVASGITADQNDKKCKMNQDGFNFQNARHCKKV